MTRCLLRLAVGLGHAHPYRERRRLHGLDVMHFVCPACGWAGPVMVRTEEGHRDAVAARPIPLRADRVISPDDGEAALFDELLEREQAVQIANDLLQSRLPEARLVRWGAR